MTERLYALQRDLDMVTQDVQNLQRGYNAVGRIAKRFDDLWLEQIAQGAQMRRIEKRLDTLEDHLKIWKPQIDKIASLETRMTAMEEHMDRMEKILLLICKKLDINPDTTIL